ISFNYVATFKLPSASLLEEPVEALSATVPILFVGHAFLIGLSCFLRGNLHSSLKSIGYGVLFTLLTTTVVYILTVLFGAPLIEKIPNTFLFAAYLSILTVMPCLQTLQENVVIKVFIQHSPTTTSEIYAYAQAVCALSGAWIGAIVLPLDWDREWQAWPISCIISTYVGHSVGVIAAFAWSSLKFLFGKRKSE
ncbi:Glycosylphosphatidylinositol anchor biosynthesis protein 11, partial [Choanephora cucurbitarum]